MPALGPDDFKDDGASFRERREAEIEKQKRAAIRRRRAGHITGAWIWFGIFYVIGIIPFGNLPRYAEGGFLALLVTMPIAVIAGFYALNPRSVPTGRCGHLSLRWHGQLR